MKKNVITLLLALTSTFVFAQETESQSDFGIQAVAKIGFGTLDSSNMVKLHGNVNAGDLLFSYRFPNQISLSAGVGTLQFTANGATAGETFSLDQTYLRIPVYFNYSLSIFEQQFDDKIQAYTGIGIYANTLLKEEYKTINSSATNKNQGWNTGVGLQLGMKFSASKNLNLGVGFESQSDLSDMEKNKAKRKLEGVTTVNFSVEFKF